MDEKFEEAVQDAVETEVAPSLLNFPNLLTNVIYCIEQEIDDAVEEKRNPFGCSDIRMSETGNSVIFNNITFEENEAIGIDCKSVIYVARIKTEVEKEEKEFFQICIDLVVNDKLVCQYRHATDKLMFEKAIEAQQASIVVSNKSNKRK